MKLLNKLTATVVKPVAIAATAATLSLCVINSANAASLGNYEAEDWKSSGIAYGQTSVTDTNNGLSFDYQVSRPGGGVSYRTTTFSTKATETGNLSFNYVYDFFHAWFNVNADLLAFSDTSSGRKTVSLVDFFNYGGTGPRTFSGSTTLGIEQGYDFGFIVGGSNYDGDSRLIGSVKISNLDIKSVPEPASMLGLLAVTGVGAASLKRKLANVKEAQNA